MVTQQIDGPLLQVSNVDIEYRTRERQVRATHDVSFDVWPGDRFILLGPSGCFLCWPAGKPVVHKQKRRRCISSTKSGWQNLPTPCPICSPAG